MRWGSTFRDAREELEFLDSSYVADATRRLTRVASSLVAWILGLGVVLVLEPSQAARLLVPNAVVIGAYVVLLITARRATRSRYREALLVTNTTSSLAIVYLIGMVLGLSHASLGGLIVSMFFVLANPTVPVPLLALSLVPAVGLEAWALTRGTAIGTDAAFSVYALVGGFVVAVGLASLSHRAARSAYAQGRTIEDQRETIARQQALLEKELSHQVAERSRELGAVLARSDVTLDARRLSPGERFAGRYRIVRALGAGGMGAVYEVERVTDGAQLALKVVVGEVGARSAARFAREAEIGARLRHPRVVSIVDVGVASGVPYLAMELVRGGSLETFRSKFGDLAWAVPVLRQIVEGLAALHDAGVVHRDLKPANVLLAGSDAKISDFGISRFGSSEGAGVDPAAETAAAMPKSGADLTGTDVVMGTPLYLAPEGARSARALDASADVFALGIIAYEMVTGRAPFTVPAFVLAMAAQPIPSPPPIEESQVGEPLRSLVHAALAADPSKRPRVKDFAAALAPRP